MSRLVSLLRKFSMDSSRFVLVSLALASCLTPNMCHAGLTWDAKKVSVSAKSSDKAAAVTYHFKNTGTTPITITEVQPSCGCTTTELVKRSYAPGEEGSLKASLAIGIHGGLQEKNITIKTDEPNVAPVILTLRANIEQLLALVPEIFLWGKDEQASEKSILIKIAGPLRIETLTVTETVPTNSVEARIEIIEPGAQFKLLARPLKMDAHLQVGIACSARFTDGTVQNFTVYALVR